MSNRAAITIMRPRDEVERRWREQHPDGPAVEFRDAPGDRGTEIHVEVPQKLPGRVGEVVGKVVGAVPLAKAKDDLSRFKQLLETGEIPRSDAVPEGEIVERKLGRRPAQPLTDSE